MADELLVPEGTRLIHVGPPKTGSSSLQGAFHASRSDLLGQGVRYAGRRRHDFSAVRWGMGQEKESELVPGARRRWKRLVAELRSAREPRVVVSSEGFTVTREPERVDRFLDTIGRERVRIVVTLRPLTSILPSQWQQNVQAGMVQAYHRWLRDVLEDETRGGPRRTFWLRHHHDELVERWASLVGVDNVTVVVLDRSDPELLLRTFERLLGLDQGTLALQPDRANRSLTFREVELFRAFNRQLRRDHRSMSRPVRIALANQLKQREPPPDEARVRTPAWALDRAYEIAVQMTSGLADSGVQVVGDLSALHQPSAPLLGRGSETGADDLDLAALFASAVAGADLDRARSEGSRLRTAAAELVPNRWRR